MHRILLLALALSALGCFGPPRHAPRQSQARPASPRVPAAPPATATAGVVLTRAPAVTPTPSPLAAKTAAEPKPTHHDLTTPCRRIDDGEPLGLHRRDELGPGRVVLTFDDGPYADHTPPVLDLLKERELSAAFFVLGRHITRKTYALLQRMEAEGHVIASHSYDHDIDMARGYDHEATVRYIVAQHDVTRMLVELALIAESPDDFDAMHEVVFGVRSDRRIAPARLRRGSEEMALRHRKLLASRGYPDGRYAVRFSRPPGGGPYLGRSKVLRGRYDEALAELGMLNVMWHAQSGDVHPTRARERAFLRDNIVRRAQRGGVLLIHDFVRFDALASAVAAIAANPSQRVVGLEEAARAKYGCSATSLLSVEGREHVAVHAE
jgi:peptidoglycan/xylan/chitin deacetylase (PgdA/CDA1 family)